MEDDLFSELQTRLKNKEYDPRHPFVRWLGRVIRNKAIDLSRRAQVRSKTRDIPKLYIVDTADEAEMKREHTAQGLATVRAEFDLLSEKHRGAIFNQIDGSLQLARPEEKNKALELKSLSPAAAAHRIGLNVANMYQIVKRFRDKCQERLKSCETSLGNNH